MPQVNPLGDDIVGIALEEIAEGHTYTWDQIREWGRIRRGEVEALCPPHEHILFPNGTYGRCVDCGEKFPKHIVDT